MAARRADTQETRTLLVETGKERFKITIPADFKVTCGRNMQGRDYSGSYELRIYEAENKQRACFVGVTTFRDLSLPITRLVVSSSGETSWQDDGDGSTARSEKITRKVREVQE